MRCIGKRTANALCTIQSLSEADLSEALEALRAVTIWTLATRDIEIDFETLSGVWVTPGSGSASRRQNCRGQSYPPESDAARSPLRSIIREQGIESETMQVSHLRAGHLRQIRSIHRRQDACLIFAIRKVTGSCRPQRSSSSRSAVVSCHVARAARPAESRVNSTLSDKFSG